MDYLDLEIFIAGKWQKLARVEVRGPEKSTFSKCYFISELEYFFANAEFEDTRGLGSASLLIPLDPTNHSFEHWPSFLLDLMPQGAARINVCKREQIIDNPNNDFLILKKGAINPVGNLRIHSTYELFNSKHPGFNKSDIIEKNELFLEHAQSFGAIVVGTTGAQGVAPKFLVNIDHKDQWHCDGALPDSALKQCLLAKMPRGKAPEDKLILKSEHQYLQIARHLGLKSINHFWWEHDILFLERFDRKCGEQNFMRYGVESLSSASGQYQLGMAQSHEKSLEIIERYSTCKEDLFEYVARDFLNIVMGNSDNHTRNTAFLKTSHQQIELSPLYDFAPMVMDSEMIARSCKWSEEIGYIPNFQIIQQELTKYRSENEVKAFFMDCYPKLKSLPTLWEQYQLDPSVIKIATRVYAPFMDKLGQFMEVL